MSKSIFPWYPPERLSNNTAKAPNVTCIIPEINDNIIAALQPPRLSAYTAIAALSKNTGTNPVIISTGFWIRLIRQS